MNSHRYLPHTGEDIARMLRCCGVTAVDDLYADVPPQLRLAKGYDLPQGMSEPELRGYFAALGRLNFSLYSRSYNVHFLFFTLFQVFSPYFTS